jgi:hypothetical protein
MANMYPALTGAVVTEAHARICAERGHATHLVNGIDSGVCPRCGEVTDLAPAPATTHYCTVCGKHAVTYSTNGYSVAFQAHLDQHAHDAAIASGDEGWNA